MNKLKDKKIIIGETYKSPFLNEIGIYQDGTVTPIEIKKGSAPKNAVKNFSVLDPIEQDPSEDDVFSGSAHLKVKVGTGAVVCMPVDLIPVDKKNWYVPAWLI